MRPPPSEELCTLPHLVRARLEAGPDHLVVREADSKRSLTWAELHDQALIWVGALTGLEVRRGDVVITMFPNSVESFVSWLAVAYLGAAESPVNDSYRGAWLSNAVRAAHARIAIVSVEFLEQWTPLLDGLDLATLVVLGGDSTRDELLSGTRVVNLEVLRGEGTHDAAPAFGTKCDVGSVLWTSGTTGPSKGVIIPWGQWWDRMTTSNYFAPDELSSSDISYRPWPVFHMSGREGLYRNAFFGGSTVIRRRFSASEWLSDIRAGGCTWTSMIGGTEEFVLAQPECADDWDNPLRFVSGAPWSERVDELRRRFGIQRIYTSLGSTEMNNPINSVSYDVTSANCRAAGKAVPTRELKLVDSAGSDVIGAGTGELLVRDERAACQMTLGYLGNPEATAETFVDGWFRTGDVLRRDADGYFYFTDRVKDMVRRRGENISSFEVEVAVRAHRAVADCAVFGVPGDVAEDDVMVVVVLRPSVVTTAAELHSFLTKSMPSFAVPRYISFADSLPRTPSAKVRKAVLRERGVTPGTWDAQRQRGERAQGSAELSDRVTGVANGTSSREEPTR